MYHTLLVPLDGSTYSERALPVAMTLARHLGVRIVLMRVASEAVSAGADATKVPAAAKAEAQAALEALAAQISEQGVVVEVSAPYGDAAASILAGIGKHKVNLVVMSTHGHSGIGRWIFGSVGEQVLAHSPVPVLLVRPTGLVTRFEHDPQHAAILVSLDGSPQTEAALPHAEHLARSFGSKLLLVRVVQPPAPAFKYEGTGGGPAPYDDPCQDAELYLGLLAQRLRAGGLTVQTVVREGWAADVLAYGCEDLKPGLIVMATHDHRGVTRLLLGEVALEVVRRSPLPVMLVQPDERATTLHSKTAS